MMLDNLSKGYDADAGMDVILHKDVIFRPLETTIVELELQLDLPDYYMGMLIARTSAAKQGLAVAMCPIDPHYNGKVNAIVYNISQNTVQYKKGESFCQLVIVPFITIDEVPHRKDGVRSDGKFGSTN